ncbi:MAG: ATP-binding cassette domain-containing protein [Clostridia bacterium]|nr:ATP-binding cassette domain-containing protein [Clostridia bacterium]
MIRIEHLVKNYGSNCAVDDISFSVESGEIVGFLGPNGAGKSTTMNILTGYISSTAGRASIAGIDILANPLEAKKLIGYLPEQPPLYLDMTVREFLNFNYDLKRCTLDRDAHIAEVCEVVKIQDVENRLIRNLSKGYRQRVGIAGALVGNPAVIIFDEPTVGLDPKQIIEIRNLIRTLGKDHTVILSTHILQEVQAVCDRIIIINKGKIVADEKTENIARIVENNRRFNVKISGPQRDVLAALKSLSGISYAEVLAERDGDAYTYTIESEMGTDIRKKLFFEMAAKGWPIIGLEALGVSLEDIFITVVDESSKGTVERERERRAVRRGERGRGRTSLESTLANDMVAEADRKRAEDAKSGYADLDAQDVPEGHDDGTGQPTGKPDTGKED